MNIIVSNGGVDKVYEKFNGRALPVSAEGGSGIVSMRFSIPVIDIQCYWSPALRMPSVKLHWTVELISAAQKYLPALSFFNSSGANRCTFGISDILDDCRMRVRMNQEKCTYDVTIDVTVPEDQNIEFDLIIDRAEGDWRDALHRVIDSFGITKPDYPEQAWNPVYCTWYVVHASVTQDWAERTAKLAAGLGLKTFIIDDGWCFDEMRRVSPSTITAWYERIGDWEISRRKFPDFDAHLKRVQAMGVSYMLWVTPFLIGTKSAMFKKLGEKGLMPGYLEGYQRLNIDDEAGCEEMVDKLASLMRRHPLDGLKIDFLDQLAPEMERPRGRKIDAFIKKLTDALRAVKSDALIEFRENYATPSMLNYATQFRAGDVPMDYQDNFRRLAQIRLELGDRVPVHADPAYWHPAELAVNVSRHMIASLAGVPMLSVELSDLSETNRKIIRHWLDFYSKHLATFRAGHWNVKYNQADISSVSVCADGENIIILNDEKRLDEVLQPGRNIVLNLSPAAVTVSGAECRDVCGEAVPGGLIPCGGSGEFVR